MRLCFSFCFEILLFKWTCCQQVRTEQVCACYLNIIGFQLDSSVFSVCRALLGTLYSVSAFHTTFTHLESYSASGSGIKR